MEQNKWYTRKSQPILLSTK